MGIFSWVKRFFVSILDAEDVLELLCKKASPYVMEWCEANPSKAYCNMGPYSKESIPSYVLSWDGPYTVTLNKGKPWEMIYNLFFQNLRRDIESIVKEVSVRAKREGEAATWILGMLDKCDDQTLAEAILKRGVGKTKEEAIAFVKNVRDGYRVGLFDDLVKGHGRRWT